jgi:hypothetical protein
MPFRLTEGGKPAIPPSADIAGEISQVSGQRGRVPAKLLARRASVRT